jgi:hypothetical protein
MGLNFLIPRGTTSTAVPSGESSCRKRFFFALLLCVSTSNSAAESNYFWYISALKKQVLFGVRISAVPVLSLRAKRGNPCALEAAVMDRHGLRPRDDGKPGIFEVSPAC